MREGNKLINVFYYFIDTDDSLVERAKEVYFNGLIWSSLADIIIISPLAIIIYIVGFLITKNMNLVFYAGIAFELGMLSIILIPFVIKKHLSLSNNQLAYIIEIHKKELQEKLIAIP